MFYNERKPASRLTKKCLVYGWATKSALIKQRKNSAQRSEEASMTTRWTSATKHKAGKKKNTLADSNYFYAEESITSTFV